MIRRSPCEYYTKFLLVHPDKYDDATVLNILRQLQLDCPGEDYLDRLRQGLAPPSIFRPYDSRHSPSFKFLVREGIYWLFHPDPAMTNAIWLLRRARAKEMIESMILSGDPDDLILHRLTAHGYRSSRSDLARYKQFFFDIELVDRTEMQTLLRMRIDYMRTDGDDTMSRARYDAMKKAHYNDPRVVAAAAPVTPFATLINQLRYGYMPNDYNVGKALSKAKQLVLARALESVSIRSPSAAADLRDFTMALGNLQALSESIGNPDEELQSHFMSLMLETTGEEVPHIHELTGGDHTLDVQPVDTSSTK